MPDRRRLRLEKSSLDLLPACIEPLYGICNYRRLLGQARLKLEDYSQAPIRGGFQILNVCYGGPNERHDRTHLWHVPDGFQRMIPRNPFLTQKRQALVACRTPFTYGLALLCFNCRVSSP